MNSKFPNCYEILGVDKNATQEQIKKSYKELALKWHPDRWSNSSESERKSAEEKMKEINNAYDALSDLRNRKAHDNIVNSPNTKFINWEWFLILIATFSLFILLPDDEKEEE